MLVGQCIPSSCGPGSLEALLATAERTAASRASAAGLAASIQTVSIRPVPGNYDIFSDFKLHILG